VKFEVETFESSLNGGRMYLKAPICEGDNNGDMVEMLHLIGFGLEIVYKNKAYRVSFAKLFNSAVAAIEAQNKKGVDQ
jgi:hypothetical protein